MSRMTKTILGILAALVIVCLCFSGAFLLVTNRVVNQTMITDPAKVLAQAAEIATFDVPDGYNPTYSFDIGGMRAVDLSGPGKSHIQLVQFHSGNYSDEEMKALYKQANQSFYKDYGNLEVSLVEIWEVKIKGETIPAKIYEGKGAKYTYRQLEVIFDSDNGPIFLAYVTPPEAWDKDLIAAFLASIR